MGVRDFDSDQLQNDWDAILDQAGTAFSRLGSSITGIWTPLGEDFQQFEEQLRSSDRYTVFLTTDQWTPRLSQTVVRAGVTYFVEAIREDAEGTGVEIDVRKTI